MKVDLAHRSHLAEMMDADDTSFDVFHACLADLEVVNRLTLAYRPTLSFFERLLAGGSLPKHRPTTIVDVGSGYGDMARQLDRWAQRHKISVQILGVDRNPWSTMAATAATPAGRPIRFVTADIFDFTSENHPDFVISSLFAHHLDDNRVRKFLMWMEQRAQGGWFINDLHRHWLPLQAFRFLSRAMRFHEFVQHDGPVSIARGFRREDWRREIDGAEITRSAVTLEWFFPFRLCVGRIRNG